jgi:3-hydroxymyristoyl/3-hydroxydecanoyl-(acyl carrier protein) dehydratase
VELGNAVLVDHHAKGGHRRSDPRPVFLMQRRAQDILWNAIDRVRRPAGLLGFGGVEETKFRQQVPPGVRLYLLGQKNWERHHRINCTVHGMVNGQLVFECSIVGTEM